jgi:hypothetical protein
MKTSKLILLFTAVIVIIALIISVMVLRNTVMLKRTSQQLNYQPAQSLAPFDRLNFSSNFSVRIIQGKNYLVEYVAGSGSTAEPAIENRMGHLFLVSDTGSRYDSTDIIHVRITMPAVYEISAVNDTRIEMNFFTADSLKIILGDGCEFAGNNNTIKQVKCSTSGDAKIELSSTF